MNNDVTATIRSSEAAGIQISDLTQNAAPRPKWRREWRDRLFLVACIAAAFVSLFTLAALLTSIFVTGWDYLSGDLLSNPPSRHPAKAGIKPAMFGTIWICTTCVIFALPIGWGTAILLEEFKPRNRMARMLQAFIQLNITNLAGVPSIVYGIVGLTAFVQMFGTFGNAMEPIWTLGTPEDWYYLQLPFGRGTLAGGLTLMLVILPIVIITAQEALRSVPGSLRQASLALGSTRWQMIRTTTLPAAMPGMMTGTILAMSRAIGEAAPILIIAGIVYVRFTPGSLMDDFTAMPLQIFDWAGRPQEEFHKVAAAGIVVLLAILFSFNAVAVFIRYKFQRPME